MKASSWILVALSVFCLVLMAGIPGVRAQERYKKWLEKQNLKYTRFKDERDRAFLHFLQQEWKKMKMMQGVLPDSAPKPVKMPVAEPVAQPEKLPGGPKVKIQLDLDFFQLPSPSRKTITPELKYPDKEHPRTLAMEFYGVPITIQYDPKILADLKYPINRNSISEFWVALSQSDYEPLLEQFKAIRDRLSLNDWGYCFFLHQVGNRLFKQSPARARLFLWYFLLKAGYDAKIGYQNNQIFLLMPVRPILFGFPFFTIDGMNYYTIPLEKSRKEIESLFTYEGRYPEATKAMDLQLSNPPQFGNKLVPKKLTFSYGEKRISIPVNYNVNLIEFYRNYPLTSLKVYFDSSPSPSVNYSLLMGLKPILENRSEYEAVAILLRFVQNAFDYETDQRQFGTEKYLFPDETVYYDRSDCEDRAVLFSVLVQELLHLEVIGLDYPGHVATAVRFHNDYPGDAVTYNGIKYLICDPTYINASPGMAMMRYKNLKPTVIKITRLN